MIPGTIFAKRGPRLIRPAGSSTSRDLGNKYTHRKAANIPSTSIVESARFSRGWLEPRMLSGKF